MRGKFYCCLCCLCAFHSLGRWNAEMARGVVRVRASLAMAIFKLLELEELGWIQGGLSGPTFGAKYFIQVGMIFCIVDSSVGFCIPL